MRPGARPLLLQAMGRGAEAPDRPRPRRADLERASWRAHMKCPDCEGPKDDTGLCRLSLDADGLPARCVGDWYADKLFYMRQYAGIFTKGMKKKWAHLAYLDPFAGPGRCCVKPSGKFDDGSPLIALGLGFTHYYLSDLSKDVATPLDTRTKRLARGDQYVLVQSGDANALAKRLNSEVKKLGRETLAFAFL